MDTIVVHMIGNAHIDPVWLWRWQAGADEVLATMRSAADRCAEYPEFIFTRGEAWTYDLVERFDPALFARIKGLIERGQWHVTGGMWIQPDANLPTETGWRRQFLHGQRYFQSRLGIQPGVAYNVDTFGHPATLPDLLVDLNYQAYAFHRPAPSQVSLPANTFRWRGPRGGEVLGLRIIPGYVTRVHNLKTAIMQAVEAANPGLGHVLCFYGVGNHGGGPTKENILYILEQQHAFPGIELRFSTPQAFVDAVLPQWDALPVVTTELQHTFPGCYSVMHDIKQAQRFAEHQLAQVERTLEVYAGTAQEQQAVQEQLNNAWNDLLLTQFHDILAGTSVLSAWRGVRAMQGRATIIGEELLYSLTRRWAKAHLPALNEHQIIVLNPDRESWDGLIEFEPHLDFDEWGTRWLSDSSGQPIPFQLIQAEAQIHVHRIAFPLTISAAGAVQLLLQSAPRPQIASETDLEVSSAHLKNAFVYVELSPEGLRQLWFEGEPLLDEQGIALQLRHDQTDTWTFHTDRFIEPVSAVFVGEGWIVEEHGPLRASVRMEGWLGHSRVRWTVSLGRGEKRLTMQCAIVFNEHFQLLQLPIFLREPISEWRDGQVAGSVARVPAATEWPVQGWSRITTSSGTQLALVTQDAYSLSVNESGCWCWTLLRSPKMAWAGDTWGGEEQFLYTGRAQFTDQGEHTFLMELYFAQDGRLEEPLLERLARQQLQRPLIFDRYEGMNRMPWGDTPPRHLR